MSPHRYTAAVPPSPAPRRIVRSSLTYLLAIALAAALAFVVGFSSQSHADAAPAGADEALVRLRAEAFRAGYASALEAGCRLTLAYPLQAR